MGGIMTMRIQKKFKQGMAMTAAISLMAGSSLGLAGCKEAQAQEDAPDTVAVENEETSEDASGGTDVAMGRYLEEDIPVPEDCGSIECMEILDDGTMAICYYSTDGEMLYTDSKDEGATWETGTSLYDLMNLDSETYSCSFPKISKEGGIFANVSEYIDKETYETGNTQFYYVTPKREVKKLDIGDLADSYVIGCEFTSRNTVILQIIGNGLAEVSLEDGSIVAQYEKGSSMNTFTVMGNRLIVINSDYIHYYDIETGKPIDEPTALTEQISSNEKNLQMTGVGSASLVFTQGDEEDSLFYIDSNGMYRYAFGGSVVEQIIDGSLNSISSPDIQFVDLVRNSEGRFYLTAKDYSNGTSNTGRILKYEYSKDTPSVPDTELKIYSLKDDTMMRQVAAVFQKKYPDIYLSLETGVSGDDAITTTDALKNLNTEIMAGKGPDIIILDGIPEDTYVEKGILMDISDILNKIDESEGFLSNIKDAYTEEDGSIYRMPVKFGIPMIQGKKEDIDTITDLKTFADAVEAHQEEYSAWHMPNDVMGSAEQLLKSLSDVCASAWTKEDGTLDEAAISEYLEQANRMYQAAQKATRELEEATGEALDFSYYSEVGKSMFGVSTDALGLLGGYSIFGLGGLYSADNLASVNTVEREDTSLASRLWNGQAQNIFIPMEVIGISAKSREPEAAEKFLQFLFSEEGEAVGKESGFPVNKAAFEGNTCWDLGGVDGVISTTSTYNSETGVENYLEIRVPTEEAIRNIKEIAPTLTTPAASNEIILNAVSGNGARYLKGECSLEEASNAIIKEVNLYLAE